MEKSIRSSSSKKEKGPSFAFQGFPSRQEKKNSRTDRRSLPFRSPFWRICLTARLDVGNGCKEMLKERGA
jgi:hypothetical protein